MMNRRTIGWIVAIALASGTALADTQNTRSQSQRATTHPSQQPQPEQTYEEQRTLEQRTRETTVAPKIRERQVSDVPSAAEQTGTYVEQKPSTAMSLEDRVEAIRLTALEKEEAVEVQTKLQDLGYYKGSIDGIVGPKTRAALQRYFRDQATLAARGMAGSAALVSLGIDESAIQRVRGREEEPQTQHGTPSTGRTPESDATTRAPGTPSDQSRPSQPRTIPPATTPPEKMEPYPTPEHRHTPGTGQSGTK